MSFDANEWLWASCVAAIILFGVLELIFRPRRFFYRWILWFAPMCWVCLVCTYKLGPGLTPGGISSALLLAAAASVVFTLRQTISDLLSRGGGESGR